MENHDKTRSEVHGFILFGKHARKDTVNGMEQTVREGMVVKEKIAGLLIDSKNAVAVVDINQFKGHAGSAFRDIVIAAVYHLIDIFHFSKSGMKGIFNFLIVVNKDFL